MSRLTRLAVAVVLVCVTCRGNVLAATPPNIVLIVADDLGWRDLGCTGSTFYETPNIDRLAAEGVRFTRAYAACPVCSPTRAAILTGMYPPRTGVTDYIGGHAEGKLLPAPYSDHLLPELTTIPQVLKRAGYVSWHVGKWHLGGKGHWPEDYGFDVNVGGYGAGHPVSYFSPYKNPKLKDGPKGEYLTDRLTDEVVKLIRDRDPGRPFFLNLWHYTVHTPLQAPEGLVEKYRKKAHAMGLDEKKVMEEGENFPTVNKANQHVVRRHVQSNPTYAAMVETMDNSVGRVMAVLDELKIADNTIVIFTSDNGGLSTAEGSPTSNDPLLDGKGWLYEGGTRVAMIVKWPGVTRAGGECGERVISTDYMPTFMEAAGETAKGPLDGRSLLPLLKEPGKAAEARPLFWHYPHYGNQGGTPGSSVLEGDYKLIERYENGAVELYDLKGDPSETHDLAKERPEVVERLREKLESWKKDVGAKMPTVNP